MSLHNVKLESSSISSNLFSGKYSAYLDRFNHIVLLRFGDTLASVTTKDTGPFVTGSAQEGLHRARYLAGSFPLHGLATDLPVKPVNRVFFPR